jgi:hypothetical protein
MKYSLLGYTLGRIALLGIGLVTLSACGQILGVEGEPVLTKDNCTGKLRVRITTDDTGPVKDIGAPYTYGLYDYMRHLNDTQGGLRGCPIDIDIKDASYDIQKTKDIVEAWRQQPEWPEVSSVFTLGTGQTQGVAVQLMEEKKLIFAGSYAGTLAAPVPINTVVPFPEVNSTGAKVTTEEKKVSDGFPYLFFPATDYSTGMRVGMHAAWKIDAGRIAMVHGAGNVCAYCVEPLAAGKSFLSNLPGMELGEDLIVPQTSNPADEAMITGLVSAYIAKEIEKKKANSAYLPVSWLWAGNTLFSTSLIGRAAAEAQKAINAAFPGIETDPTDPWKLRVMANNWGIGETSPTICGAACNGILYGLFPVPRYGDVQNAPGMSEMMVIHDKYRGIDGHAAEAYRDVRYVQGHAAALMWRKSVELALDADHITPTGEDLKNALETFNNVNLAGMTAGPISFSPTDHRPQSNEAVYVFNNKMELEFYASYNIALLPEWLGY